MSAAYVQAEFQMSQVHSNRLLNQGQVILEIAKSAGAKPDGLKITEAEARDLKPQLEQVVRLQMSQGRRYGCQQ